MLLLSTNRDYFKRKVQPFVSGVVQMQSKRIDNLNHQIRKCLNAIEYGTHVEEKTTDEVFKVFVDDIRRDTAILKRLYGGIDPEKSLKDLESEALQC